MESAPSPPREAVFVSHNLIKVLLVGSHLNGISFLSQSSCYKFVNEGKNWEDASKACLAYKTNLVSIQVNLNDFNQPNIWHKKFNRSHNLSVFNIIIIYISYICIYLMLDPS